MQFKNILVKDFYLSSWHGGESPVPMLVARVMLAVVAIAILVWAIAEAPDPYWLLYLTNWGLVLVTGMMISAVVVSVAAVLKKIPPDSIDLPWYVSTYWVLYNIGITMAFLISALYWTLLFDFDKFEESRLFWLDVATHALNSTLVLLELLMSRTPTYFLHIYQPLCCGLWYAVFSGIYYICGGTDMSGNPFIYDILDWRMKKRSLFIVFLSIIALIIIWCMVWAISYGRNKLSDSIFHRSRTSKETSARRDFGNP